MHNTRPYTRLPPGFMGMDDLTTDLIRKQRVSLMSLGFVLNCYLWMLYNQALADVPSTGAGIKCLYCTSGLGIDGGFSRFIRWFSSSLTPGQ